MHLTSRFNLCIVTTALMAACGTAQMSPSIRGGPDRFTVSIGIDRMKDLGGEKSAAMKRVLDEQASRYCSGPYTIRSVTNTAAEMMFNGYCGSKE